MTYRKKQRMRTGTRKKGGKVIGAGGFGCVFRPALRCKTRKQRASDKVSKLMRKKYVQSEYRNIKNIEKRVKSIPNFQHYFLVGDITTCSPALLTNEDLENFNTKCDALKKIDITESNINEKLDQLTSLNLPYGGIRLSLVLHKLSRERRRKDFELLVKKMIDLLVNGIRRMNNIGVFHGDVKESNMLFNPTTQHVGLIDWGLSFYGTDRKQIPKVMKNKPFQYNYPFSLVLFNDTFAKSYSAFIREHALTTRAQSAETITDDMEEGRIVIPHTSITLDMLHDFLKEYVYKWIRRREGHISTIRDVWNAAAKVSSVTKEIIVPYLAEVLLAFTDKKGFKQNEYFTKIFMHNVDIWGFLMAFSPVLEKNMFGEQLNLSDMYDLHLLQTATRPINIEALSRDLGLLTKNI